MNLKNHGPIFVPPEHITEIAACSKAALMDMLWDNCILRGETNAGAISCFRETRDIIELYREKERNSKRKGKS